MLTQGPAHHGLVDKCSPEDSRQLEESILSSRHDFGPRPVHSYVSVIVRQIEHRVLAVPHRLGVLDAPGSQAGGPLSP
jgi:hypothetical protein